MSFYNFLFCFPFSYTLKCYSSLSFTPPLLEKTKDDYEICKSEIIEKFHLNYYFLLESTSRTDIKNKIKKFITQQNIRKDLIFIELPFPSLAAATGTNLSQYGRAAIFLNTGLYEADKNACNFIIKHEISHIKHHDVFTIPFVGLICQLAATIFGMYYLSFSYAVRLALIVGTVSHSLFSVWREGKADDFAIENSSVEELKGARRFFIAAKEVAQEQRDSLFGSLLITPDGENRLNIAHPSIKSRIEKIEKALKSRNIFISPEDERQKITNNLKPHIRKIYI